MKYIKRIAAFVLLLLFYFVIKEFIQLYYYLSNINELLAVIIIALLGLAVLYFGVIPIFQILFMRVEYGPAKNKEKIPSIIQHRLNNASKNKYLKEINYNFTELSYSPEEYQKVLKVLEKRCDEIRKKYITRLFYSTSISQNGFLDAIIIFSTAVNLVKEIFILYRGRVSNRDLYVIGKKVYIAILVGGSEGIENATDEIFNKFASETLKSIPFLDKIIGSLVDGFINAAIVTRISLITENYCKLLYIEKERDLYPSYKTVINTTKIILSDILEKSRSNLFELSKEKSKALLESAINPVVVLFEKSGDFVKSKVLFKEDSFFNSQTKKLKKLFKK